MLLGLSSKAARLAMILRGAHLHGRDRCHGDLYFAAIRGIIDLGKGLPVVFRPGDNHEIDQDAGNFYLARIQISPFGDSFHLHYDNPARVPGRHCHGKVLQGEGFPFHRDVTVGVGGRAPENGHVDGESFVEKIFFSPERYEFDQVGAPGSW